MSISNDVLQKVKVINRRSSGSKENFELIMTLHRNETRAGGVRAKCITKTLQTIEAVNKMYYTFIQTDKPIYKPGDLVRFRVIVVDRDLKPFHFNNINVYVSDPLSRTIKEFVDPGEMYIGVFTSNFTLSSRLPLGIWKLRVVIDFMNQYETYKTFAVERFVLPPFSVHITTNEANYLTSDKIRFTISAQYSFGDYVRGNAHLIVRDVNTNHVYYSNSFPNIHGSFPVGLRVQDDLGIETQNKVELAAVVIFTEPESGISANETTKIKVHANNEKKIIPKHSDKYMPGLPFHVKVFTFDWNDKILETHVDPVKFKYMCNLKDGSSKIFFADEAVRDGVAMHAIEVPENAKDLAISITFVTTTYSKQITLGEVGIATSKITVGHSPK